MEFFPLSSYLNFGCFGCFEILGALTVAQPQTSAAFSQAPKHAFHNNGLAPSTLAFPPGFVAKSSYVFESSD
jgi:hypothetical protein